MNDKQEQYVEIVNCYADIQALMRRIKAAKPNDRSSADRRFAVVLTDLEGIEAYFSYFVVDGNE